MINRISPTTSEGPVFLSGFSQELPGLAESALPAPGTTYMLPSLAWHRNSCGPVAFDTYVGLANPGTVDVTVSLSLGAALDETSIYVDGQPMGVPANIGIPARGWKQARPEPVGSPRSPRVRRSPPREGGGDP